MADIQYLNYGDQQIEQQALLNTLANNVQSYVAKQPWSNKRKEKFMSAYSDIMNKGLKGASNTSGQWTIDVGDTIDLDSKSKKDKEMYQEAAYFIQQQMAGLPTKSSQEKKDESELPKYDSFFNNFTNYLSQTYYGGNSIRTQEDWNILDERNPNTGLRGTDKRVKRLSDYLKAYSNSLEEGKYNFEGSPFKNLTDLKTRINNAITKLDDGTWNQDDADALNAIGLRSSDWFNNGSGDTFIADDGKEYTYGNYYGKILPAQKKAEAEAQAAKQKAAQQTAYNNTIFFNRVTNNKMHGRSAQALKEKYGDDQALRQALYNYAQSDIRTLTPDQQSEVQGAYRYLAKDPIDDKLLKQLQSSSSGLYRNATPNRFKKINGIDNLIWDSVAGQIVQINTRQQQQAMQNQPTDLFAGVKTQQDKENEYFRNANDGFTDADRRELEAIALDLTAMFDPTRIYGTVAGVGASGLRTYNRWTDADGFTLGDVGASILDLGLNGVQWLPGVGNVANGAKGILSLAKFAPKIGRIIARGGAAGGLIYGISGLPEVWNKIDFAHPIDSAKRLTVEDWRKLSALIAGIKGTRDLNVTNRATRRVLERNDVQVSNRWSDKVGLTRTKIESEVNTPTVKMKVGDKEVNIPIDEKVKQNLSKRLNKKGNNSEERSKVAREDVELQKAAEKAGIKVKDKDGKITKEWEEAVITYEPSWRDKTFFRGRQIPGVAKNAGTFGTSTSSASNVGNPQKFQEYLDERGLLDKALYGSNTTLRRINNNLQKNGIYGTGKTEQQSETPKVTEIPKATETPKTENKSLTPEEIKQLKEKIKEFNKYTEGTAKHSGNNLSEEPFKAGDFNFEVNKFPNSSAGNIDISFNGNVKNISFKNQEDMMKKVAEFFKGKQKIKRRFRNIYKED